ncbi:MAG: DUF3471 domain-containing protein [Opitutaceae bacterium]|nr:DUF3471 domain-containing protein [Opitutaceae bacterium]
MTVPVATLETYVGVYELRPGFQNTIRLKDGHLTTQLTGQRAHALLAESETKFFLTDLNAQIEFVRDANGRVTDLVMFQHGRSRKVPRVAG